MMVYPLAIGGSCIITSIIGTWFVKLGKSKNIMGALYKGFIATAVLSLIILYPITKSSIGLNNFYSYSDIKFTGFDLYLCALAGLVITGLIIWITEYYTGTQFRPVKSVAQSSTTGHGTNVFGTSNIYGSNRIPALIIVVGIICTYNLMDCMELR